MEMMQEVARQACTKGWGVRATHKSTTTSMAPHKHDKVQSSQPCSVARRARVVVLPARGLTGGKTSEKSHEASAPHT